MSSDHSPPISLWMILPVCLLLFTVSGQALAAGGSTRLTIHLDQGVVDTIIKWRKDRGLPPAPPPVVEADRGLRRVPTSTEADRVLQRVLPVVRAGLVETHHPRSTERILQRLRTDAILVFDGRAEHAGSAGGVCVSGISSGGDNTVHSI